MRKEKSWTRQVYEQAYAAMRRGFSDDYMAYNMNFGKDIIKAADYSYQGKDYFVTGWLNDRRLEKFIAKLEYKHHSYWWIPF